MRRRPRWALRAVALPSEGALEVSMFDDYSWGDSASDSKAGSIGILFGRPEGRGGTAWADDDRFEYEADAAEALEIPWRLIPLGPVVNGAPERALEGLPRACGRRWLYRGWMLDAAEYEGLYEAVLARGDALITPPGAFEIATYVPNWAPLLEEHTPATRWTWGEDITEAWELAQEIGPGPWIVKDHVKSAKEDWAGACFVPAGADYARFAAVCRGLIDARGDRFERGIVVRRFVDLAPLPYVAGPDRMITEEHRIVFWQGRPVACAPYHDVEIAPIDPAPFAFLGDRIDSPFFTADVARLREGGRAGEGRGGWTVIEINDGGCSTLPELMDPRELYEAVIGG